jgi:hypothetical protein
MKVTEDNLAEHRRTHDKSNSWWQHDARGIPLCRVCDDCIDVALQRYKPAVLGIGSGRYEDAVEEQIEPEEGIGWDDGE